MEMQQSVIKFMDARTRLENDVVTGKLDVPQAAASLPDLAEDDVPDIGGEVVEDEVEMDEEEVA